MGAVYRAQDLRFKVEKIVAVKEMINQATDQDIQATIVEGFENLPAALSGLFEGANTGKMIVKV